MTLEGKLSQKKWYENNKEKKLALNGEWRKNNPERTRELGRKHDKKRKELFPEKLKSNKFKQVHGITLKERNDMIDKQGGKCKICGDDFSKLPERQIHIDHDHIKEYIRGVLCHKCNTMLGLARDNINILKKAIEYITPEELKEIL